MMTSPEWLGALARYNRWMIDELHGIAATLSDDLVAMLREEAAQAPAR